MKEKKRIGKKCFKKTLSAKICHFIHATASVFSLQLAAESNSAECAKILLEGGATAGTRDDSGMTVLTLMITKMPSVVSGKCFFAVKMILVENHSIHHCFLTEVDSQFGKTRRMCEKFILEQSV